MAFKPCCIVWAKCLKIAIIYKNNKNNKNTKKEEVKCQIIDIKHSNSAIPALVKTKWKF